MESLKIFKSIREIPKEDWDEIFPSILQGHKLATIIEDSFSPTYQFYYVAIYKESDIVCLMPAFKALYSLDTTLNGPFKSFTTGIKRLWPEFLSLQVLLLGCPISIGKLGIKTECMKSLIPLMTKGMMKLAKQEHLPIIAFKDFNHEPTQFFDALKDIGFHQRRSFPSVTLKLPFTSFDDYMDSLSAPTRRGFKEKLRKTAEAPITMVVQNTLGPWLEEAYELYCQTLSKSDIQFEVVPKDFFERVSTVALKEYVFFLWFLEGKLIAFHFCIAENGVLTDKYIGLDYAWAYQYHLYFYTFRDIIRWSLNNGIHSFEGGALSYEPKKRLKFSFTAQYIYFKHQNAILNGCLSILSEFLKPERFDPVIKLMYEKIDQEMNRL